MTSEEVDLSARQWNLPASRTKNGHAHSVPLSDLAVDIIRESLPGSKRPRLFDMTALAVARAIQRAQPKFGLPRWTAHDLRRTTLTGLARLGVSPTVLGFVANHRTITRGGITMMFYIHYSYDREKREALELWSDRLKAITGGETAKIVPLKGRA